MLYVLNQEELDDLISKRDYEELLAVLTRKNKEMDTLYEVIAEQSEEVSTTIFQSLAAKMDGSSQLTSPSPTAEKS